jgi:hypothetical protein
MTDSIHLQKNGLEKEKEEAYPDNFSDNHHEELWSVGHLTHDTDFSEKSQYRQIST